MKKIPFDPRLFIAFSDLIKEFYSRESSELAKLELKPSQARILHFLSDFVGLNQQELADVFGLKPSTMSELLSGLENVGYIQREVNPENKRMTFIVLSAKGRDCGKKIYQLFEEYCLELMKDFSVPQKK